MTASPLHPVREELVARSSVRTAPRVETPFFRYSQHLDEERTADLGELSVVPVQRVGTDVVLHSPAPVTRAALIGCVIPAYNEEESIAAVLASLLDQTRPPDFVFVVVNNTTDRTTEIARQSEGIHQIEVDGETYTTVVEVHDIGRNEDKKVGALNYGWRLVQHCDFLLGVDGDTTLEPTCLEWLEKEMVDDSRIGGLSAIYSVDPNSARGPLASFLLAGQRSQFAAFNMDNLVRERSMAVLGGQCSLFRIDALRDLVHAFRQDAPWVRDSEVEDSYLSLQLKDKRVAAQTKISARARAYVGGMGTVSSLHSQQVKWTHGAVELIRRHPLHPNLRLRWRENVSMFFNIFSRVLFVALLVASLSIGAFVFNAVWLVPPLVAVALGVRTALSMHDRRVRDVVFAATLIPAEIYMWLRIEHFVVSWYRSLAKVQKDNWALQAAAEKGGNGKALLYPLLWVGVSTLIIVMAWRSLDLYAQSLVLAIGWPVLGVIATALTLGMLRRLLRRQRSFKV